MASRKANTAARQPRPPFVELAFYFADIGSEAAFFQVVDRLLSRGAALAGPVLLGEPGDVDDLADLIHSQVDEVTVGSRDELVASRKSTGRTIAGVTLTDVGPGSAGRDVEVRVLPIPDTAVGSDHHPIAIWADGRAFEPGATPTTRNRATREVRDLFVDLVTALSPAYGAILVEWPLPSPSRVAAKPTGFEFADSYLSADYVGRRKYQGILDLLDAEHRTDVGNGTLLLTSGLFAPKPDKAEDIRTRAATAIAARA